ncbi:MAG: capsular biosynthesis protein [Alicyclobacillus herbarius]|uniref:YveK family protein n=1 Tax=Alicyclobacillus herbarius TaxID=122960 RepID=UPI00040ED634|nr:Wzz/FepE/Etk N-terminal domain-containing protein [Alicyclobacillus herbarius]MCL6633658.1 capsular biosynthesis protein [Alicyclobacillus herbarius]
MEELELREYWNVIRKRWKLVVAIPIIAVIISGVLSFFVLTPQYQSTTTLLVNQKSSDNQPGMEYQTVMANQALVKTYSDIIKSATMERAVIADLSLDYTPQQLDSMIDVSAPDQSQVIQVTVTNPSPKLATRIANTLAQIFQRKAESLMDVKNVQIVDPAVTPKAPTPVKPNKKLNLAIALVLGLMVSIGLAFLLEYLDTRLKTEEEVTRYLKLPVIGTIVDYEGE